jgi:hypothetical protein
MNSSQFDRDIEKICTRLFLNGENYFPMHFNLTTNNNMRKLFFGIQKRDISDFMKEFDIAIADEGERMNNLILYQRKMEELKENVLPTIKSEDEYKKMTIPNLKKELARLGLYGCGNKSKLIEKILEYKTKLESVEYTYEEKTEEIRL